MKIGIFGAMDVEIAKFNELFNLKEKEKDIYFANYNNHELYVTQCGIGKVNSAANCQHLIDKYNVNLIINTGCAGSLLEDVKVLDVVLASYVTYHDFTPVRIMNYSVPDEGKPVSDINYTNLAKEVIEGMNLNVFVEGICSGDCFVTNDKQRDEIRENTKCYAVDMESASIGHISRKNNVPFIIVRTISDFADGAVDFEEKAGHISSDIVKHIIERI